MSNARYPLGLEGFATAEIDWDTAVIKAALIRGYTYDAADKFMSDVTGAGGTIVSTTTALASKTATDGVLDAADATFASVATGAACDVVIVFQSSAVTGGSDVASSAQRVITFIDDATNLPATPNGGDINIAWDNGSDKIQSL